MNEQTVIIEKNKPYSACALWDMQRNYFDSQGIDAWVDQVPFYVTSNPFIAATYAKMVYAFMVDWLAQHPEAKDHTFYCLELGTGSGRFSYYFIKKLCAIIDAEAATDIKFCYVMSDFTQNNLNFWNQHDKLQPFVERGVLDYALYNMELEQDIELQHSKKILSPETLKNPLTVFANYIFDTVSNDVFWFENNRLFETLVTLKTSSNNVQNEKVLDWSQVKVDYKVQLAKNNFYSDDALNQALGDYRELLDKAYVTIPIGGLRALQLLRKLSNNRLLLISSDKGI